MYRLRFACLLVSLPLTSGCFLFGFELMDEGPDAGTDPAGMTPHTTCDLPACIQSMGAECSNDADCFQSETVDYRCLTQFEGGYCGIENCGSSDDCPRGFGCVELSDRRTYCLELCVARTDCNSNRTEISALENCSGVEHIDDDKAIQGKACVPPLRDGREL